MTSYVLEARSLEHRCQCCGEFADAVFCEGCDPHPAGPEASVLPVAEPHEHTGKRQSFPRPRH